MPVALRAALRAVGVRLVELAPPSGASQGNHVLDVDGVYAPFLKSLDADVVLMRPDFVVYGHADRAGLSHLTDSLLQLLQYTSTRAQHRGP